MTRRAIFPGSFDPFTLGHADIVRRGLELCDSLVIAVGYNEHKQGWIPVEERVRALQELYGKDKRISVTSYSCLTVDFAREQQATFILRGVRSFKDFEYEQEIAEVNRRLSQMETVILFADPTLSCVSSSTVRELAHFGRDVREWLPQGLNYNF